MGIRDEDTLSTLVSRLARMDRELQDKDREELKEAAEGKPLKQQVSLVFERRLAEVNAALKKLAEERTLLERTVEPKHGATTAPATP